MAKTRFNLNYNGKAIRYIDELRENFSVEAVLEDYQNGRLDRWLEARWFHNELEKVRAIRTTEPCEILSALIHVFKVEIKPDDAATPQAAELIRGVLELWEREEQARRGREEQERREREEQERREREERERRERVAKLNSTFRGECLGGTFTEEQSAAIRAGTFDGMALGDYWTINGVNWRIADFDYLIRSDDAEVAPSRHHVMIVPDKPLYKRSMNDTDTTDGGYAGSKMRTSGLDEAKAKAGKVFGGEHILTYRGRIENGEPGGIWTDCGVELMTKEMVFGDEALGLFRLQKDLASGWYWFQDTVSASRFAYCLDHGVIGPANALVVGGVRPAFAIC